MTTTPLIVGGLLTVATVDFSDAITKATLLADADEIVIPATLAGPKSSRRGGVKYSLQIDYLSNDTSTTAELFGVLWTAITTEVGLGELAFTLQMRDGTPSASNPQWTGTLVVLQAQVGGDAEGLSTGSSTFPLAGVPTRAIS